MPLPTTWTDTPDNTRETSWGRASEDLRTATAEIVGDQLPHIKGGHLGEKVTPGLLNRVVLVDWHG